MASAQIGKTETFLGNPVGYFIHQDPAPILVVQPTLEIAEAWSKDRLAPMLKDTPVLNGLVKDARSRDSDNTIRHKTFSGGHITIAGANSPASLASRPIRIVFLDEVDKYKESAGTEGDPVKLAIKRTTAFWNKKWGMCSTPTIKGASRIEAAYLGSDQRKYFVPCPHCNEFQILQWKNITWDQTKNERGKTIEHFPETTRYACDHCGVLLMESDKARMLLRGEWRAEKQFKGIAGFHINELYSPFVRWHEMVENFLEDKKLPETLKVFINTSLGETWEERGESVDKESLSKRREYYKSEVPQDVLVLTAFVDVQADRLEIEWKGWANYEENWGVHYKIIHGDPSCEEVWKDLGIAIMKEFPHESGGILKAACVVIDSGFLSDMVYKFCGNENRKKLRYDRLYASKGSSDRTHPVVAKKAKVMNHGSRLFIIGPHNAKEIINGRLGIEELGPGYCHFPMNYDEEYFDQLTSEHCVTRFEKGVPVRKWELKKGKKRNEALDLFCGNLAAVRILNPDFEYLSKKMKPKEESSKEAQIVKTQQKTKVKKRSGGWMNSWKN